MSIEQIFVDNPHATALIQSWFMGKMLESLSDTSVPEDFREMMKERGVELPHLIKMVEGSPRGLFDVLDENDVVVQINTSPNFSYSINGGESISGSWEKRTEAELAAIKVAIEMLENKIKES